MDLALNRPRHEGATRAHFVTELVFCWLDTKPKYVERPLYFDLEVYERSKCMGSS